MATKLTPAIVLAAWTFLVWTTRIRNVWTDDGLSTAGQLGRTALALTFTGFALAVTTVAIRARRTGESWAGARALVRAFALWTVGVWVIRGVQIAAGDHSVGFVAVHTVLAAVSIGLAVWADATIKDHRLSAQRTSPRT